MMGVTGHVFACMYFALAIKLMKNGQPNTWVATDGLAFLNYNNTLVIAASTSYSYLRSLYWSVQTLETVNMIIIEIVVVIILLIFSPLDSTCDFSLLSY